MKRPSVLRSNNLFQESDTGAVKLNPRTHHQYVGRRLPPERLSSALFHLDLEGKPTSIRLCDRALRLNGCLQMQM